MTTPWLGSEVLVDAVVLKLQANMPTRITEINVEKADDVTVATPDNGRYFTAAKRLIPPPGPAILVMDGPMNIERGGDGPHSLITNTIIGVWAMDEDSDEQRLAKRLERLSRAIIESLWDGSPMEALAKTDGSQLAYSLRPNNTIPGHAFEPDHGGPNLREFYLTLFSVKRLEGQ